MSETPVRGVRFIHNALRAEVAAIERAAHAANPDLPELQRRVTYFEQVNHAHMEGEEDFIFPLLEQKAPDVAAAFLSDHGDERGIVAELKDLLAGGLDGRDGPARRARLRRQSTALVEHLLPHAHKEETVIVPLLEARSSLEEQAAAVAGAIGRIPPQLMPQVLPWIINHNSPEDQVIYVTELLRNAPPQIQPLAVQWIQGGVPAATWQNLAASVSGLK